MPKIRSGEKTQTIRLWRCRRMKSGQRSYIPGIGYIRITCVEAVKLADLTDADALPDGFPTADLLRREIQAIYREKTQKHCEEHFTPYRICFEVYPPHIQEQMREERKLHRTHECGEQTEQTIGLVQFVENIWAKLRRMAG